MKFLKTFRVLVALALLAPLAAAAPPPTEGWVHNAGGGLGTAVAVADTAAVGAAAFAAVAAPGNSDQDVAAFNMTNGTLWTNYAARAPGKDFVAISRDGGAIVAAQAAPQSGPTAPPNVVFYDTDRALTPSTIPNEPPYMAPAWSKKLATTPTALALSANGNVVAVADEGAAGTKVRAYGADGSERASADAGGAVHDLALTRDGARMAAGGSVVAPDGVTLYGQVFVTPTTSASVSRYTVDVGGPVTAIAYAADGTRLAAATETGRFLYFRPSGGALGAPVRLLDLGLGQVHDLALAASGDVLVAGAERGVALLALGPDTAQVLWNRTTQNPVRSVDVSGDGRFVLAVARDAHGFAAHSSTPIWNLTGPFDTGAMDDAARWMLLSAGPNVRGFAFQRGVALLHDTGAGLAETVPPSAPGPDGAARFPVRVVSNGSAYDRVAIEFPNVPGVAFEASSSTVDLAPGGSVAVEIAVRPQGVPPGTYAWNVTARSLTGGAEANLTLPVQVGARGGFALALSGPAERTIPRGGTDEAVLVVENRGNVRVNATLAATQDVSTGLPWALDLQPKTVSVPGGGRTTVLLSVVPPPTAANGTISRVLVTATSDQGTSSAAVTYTYAPNAGVALETPSRVRFVGPAQSAWFNLTVANTGSVRTAYEVFFEVVQQTGAGWNVDVDVSPFNLSAGGTRTIPLRVFAPNTGTISDRVTLFVEVRTLERLENRLREPVAHANLTLIANLNPDLRPKPPDFVPEDGILQVPGLSGLVAAAAGAAVALARRRRSG